MSVRAQNAARSGASPTRSSNDVIVASGESDANGATVSVRKCLFFRGRNGVRNPPTCVRQRGETPSNMKRNGASLNVSFTNHGTAPAACSKYSALRQYGTPVV